MAAGVTGSTRYFGYRRCAFESRAASVNRVRKFLSVLASGMMLLAAGCVAAAKMPVVVAIIVDAYDSNGVEIKRLVSITATAWRKDGTVGVWYNGKEWVPYPMKVAEETPFSHSQTILPGESTFIELSAVLLGEPGTAVECSVYVNGQLQVAYTRRDVVGRIENTDRTFNSSAVTQCSFSYYN